MLRCVLGKDTLRLFSIGDKQSAGGGGQPDEDVQTKPQSAQLIRMNLIVQKTFTTKNAKFLQLTSVSLLTGLAYKSSV